MGHAFQAECWEKHPSGYHLLFTMAKEIFKGIGKDFEKANRYYWHLFMKIKEIRRKGRSKVTVFM